MSSCDTKHAGGWRLLLAPLLLVALAADVRAEQLRAEQPGINLAELERAEDEQFARLDADGDGMVTPAELALQVDSAASVGAVAAPHGRPAFGVSRALGMGVAPAINSDTQARDPAAERFEHLDQDGDGVLTLDEFRALPVMATLHNRNIQVRVDSAHGREATAPAASGAFEQYFAHLDRNADGVIMRDEMPGTASNLRARDSDGDGFLTGAEMAPGGREVIYSFERSVVVPSPD